MFGAIFPKPYGRRWISTLANSSWRNTAICSSNITPRLLRKGERPTSDSMWTRREFLLRGSGTVVGLTAGARGLAGDDGDRLPDGSAAKDMITPAAQQAIDQGLAYLAQRQHSDGSFGAVQYQGNVAITSLAALAMMAAGHQPGRGAHRDVVSKALSYVLDQDDGRGYLISRTGTSHCPMYGHC